MSKQARAINEYQDNETLLNVNKINGIVSLPPVLIRELFRLGLIDSKRQIRDLLFECTLHCMDRQNFAVKKMTL
jgi:hypothetical protein